MIFPGRKSPIAALHDPARDLRLLEIGLISTSTLPGACRMHVQEFEMPFSSFPASASAQLRRLWSTCSPVVLLCAVVPGMLNLEGFAQMSVPPSRPPKPIIAPEANRLPDANDQMMMREEIARKRNFDAANAERLKEVMQATEALETMAIALKAEVDKSEDLSENTIHKADTIEKLAHSVKERMTLTVAQN
jgi:hypothetical protein